MLGLKAVCVTETARAVRAEGLNDARYKDDYETRRVVGA